MKMNIPRRRRVELYDARRTLLSQERTFLRYYGLLAGRFCFINKIHAQLFDEVFMKQYSAIHRLETNKLRNVAKFARLLATRRHVVDVFGVHFAHRSGDDVEFENLHQDSLPSADSPRRSA